MRPASPVTLAGRRKLGESVAFEISRRARLAPCCESSNVCVIGAANRLEEEARKMSLNAHLKVAKYREKRS
jgi:hypothetical protein